MSRSAVSKISTDMQATILKSSSLYKTRGLRGQSKRKKTGSSSEGADWYNRPSINEMNFPAVQIKLGQDLAGQPVNRD